MLQTKYFETLETTRFVIRRARLVIAHRRTRITDHAKNREFNR